MPITWFGEAFDYPPDPQTGVARVRLTTSLYHHVNVYCEFACATPDGRRFAILRSNFCDPRVPPYDLMAADLHTLGTAVIEKSVTSFMVTSASWSGWLYYISAQHELVRANLATLDREVAWERWPFDPDFVLLTVSPDLRFLLGQRSRPDFVTELIRIDLAEKDFKVIMADPEISNAHALYNPVHGREIVILKCKGIAVNDRHETRDLGTPRSIQHVVIDNEGQNARVVPFNDHTTGHSGWIADTGMVACTGHSICENNRLRHRPETPEGNLFFARPGDAAARCFKSPEYCFHHLAMSKCGKYFVSESYAGGVPGPVPLVVGNFQTGKYRPLLMDCQASGGAAPVGHAHAYFTADSRHVIYNANPAMIGHVWAARVPEGFLGTLS